jgi:hypothetical protein
MAALPMYHLRVLAMSRQDELRAKAQELLERARATQEPSEGLLYVMRSIECDREADFLEETDIPEPHGARKAA